MIRIRPALSVAAFVFVLALPAAAQAKTKTVLMGTPPAASKQLQKSGVDVNAYFPETVTVNVGDSVTFAPVGFHSLDIPNKGGADVLGLFAPTGTKISGSLDAAGSPFWFNGQDNLAFSPALAGVSGFGKKFVYTGAKRIESGLPLAAKPKPVTVKFTKAGSFDYYCDIHPGMEGTVKVLKKGKAVPTAKQDAASVKAQVTAAEKAAPKLQKTPQPANTVSLGAVAKNGVEYFGMVPGTLTIPHGTTVTFVMPKGTVETHTATFGPGNPDKEPTSYLGQIAGSLDGPAPDPKALYPSDVTPVTFAPATHGNGFWSSGALDTTSLTPQIPASSKLTFGTPGTYTYYCLIHPFMVGSIVVT